MLEVDRSAKTFHFAPLEWQTSFGVPYRAEWSPDGARLLLILKRGVVKGIRQDAACERLLVPYAAGAWTS